MEHLFTNLSHAVEGTPLIALAAAAVWGVLSIVLSPCHLASIPLIVGFISEQGRVTTRRAFWTSVLFAVGLHLLGVIPMPWSGPEKVGMKRKGLLAAFILGLLFGIALGPCTFAYMAPMLGVTFKLAKTEPLYGVSLLLAYGVGHCAVIVAAGTSTEMVQRFLNWNEQSKGIAVVKIICGVLVILGGVWLVYSA